MRTNVMYLAVLPLINIGHQFGLTDQSLTLFPDRNFATEFTAEEVDTYIATFERRANEYLVGGNVVSYTCQKQQTVQGLFVVKVVQNVK